MDLLGLDRGRLRRVLDMLRLNVLRLDVLLNVLLGWRTLLLLLRVLLTVLGMLDVLLLLRSVLRDRDRWLNRALVLLLLLLLLVMVLLGLGLRLGLGLGLGGLGVWLGSICPVVHGIVATIHIRLSILVLGAVTPSRRVSKRRLLLRLHRYGLLGLGRP
jgi:hypothetical protein